MGLTGTDMPNMKHQEEKILRYCSFSYKILKGEPTWHNVLPHLDGKSVHPLSSDATLSSKTDFHKKTHESDIPPLLFDHHNCDLFDQVRPIHWVDPKAEVTKYLSLLTDDVTEHI